MTPRTPKTQQPEPPQYRELVAGQVIRPAPGLPCMLDADPRPTSDGLVLLTFTDGTWMEVEPTSRPMDVVPLFDYEINAYSPGQLGAPSHRDRPTPIVCWAHADDLEEKAARLRDEGYTDITWCLRSVCEETYRLCYGTRPPAGEARR